MQVVDLQARLRDAQSFLVTPTRQVLLEGPPWQCRAGSCQIRIASWARPCHICTGTGLAPATSAPGLGSPLPHLHRNRARPCNICTGTGLTRMPNAPVVPAAMTRGERCCAGSMSESLVGPQAAQASGRTLVPTTVVVFNDGVLLARELPAGSGSLPKLRSAPHTTWRACHSMLQRRVSLSAAGGGSSSFPRSASCAAEATTSRRSAALPIANAPDPYRTGQCVHLSAEPLELSRATRSRVKHVRDAGWVGRCAVLCSRSGVRTRSGGPAAAARLRRSAGARTRACLPTGRSAADKCRRVTALHARVATARPRGSLT
jgi:hypothetical protein